MYKTVDLFAGAGGLSYGFEMTGKFVVVAAAENNKNAQMTYVANHSSENLIMISDVRGYNFKELSTKLGGVDIVIGGPPCQGFSNANRQKNHIISMNNTLVKEYFRAIKEINPKAFVMENVAMLASNTHKFYDSKKDHDEMVRLGIKMETEDLIIADADYNGFKLMNIFTSGTSDEYRIGDDLYQLINVLFKNRTNKKRLHNYIIKNATHIKKTIEKYKDNAIYYVDILERIKEHIEDEQLNDYFEELGKYIKFQKAFRLKQELDDNEILYELIQNQDNGKLYAKVNSYTVYEYINKILDNQYVTSSGVLNSLWFGVPQERRRFVMMGVNKNYVNINHIDEISCNEFVPVTVQEAIIDLEHYKVKDTIQEETLQPYKKEKVSKYAQMMRAGSKGVYNHIVPKTRTTAQQRFSKLQEGDNFHKLPQELKENYAEPSRTQNSIYLRLDYSKPCGTVVNVRKSMWVHPTIDRAISIREAARLQSFPDKFIFQGTKDNQYQQIGNAVPPLMAKGIAEHLLKYI